MTIILQNSCLFKSHSGAGDVCSQSSFDLAAGCTMLQAKQFHLVTVESYIGTKL